MTTITLLINHPEALAIAALELSQQRAASGRRMVERIGTDGCRPDGARRKLGARALREAAAYLEQAAALVEAGQ